MTSDSAQPGTSRVLIVDDEENIRHLLLVILKKAGYEPTAVSGGREALALLEQERFSVVISDIRMPDMDGRELLRAIRAGGIDVYTVMMSAYGGDEVAIACMKEGAYDYFNKPFAAEEVILLLRKIAEREQLRLENRVLREQLGERLSFDNIIGRGPAMQECFTTVSKVARYDTTVLITGESGTGKELIARAVHHNSGRSTGRLIPVNCAAIPENLLESELFGHARGAFTGAVKAKRGLFHEASGGTLFLDEMGDMPMSLQAKLLRALESGEVRRVGETKPESVDVRLVAATSKDLEQRVREGLFREDLFYRLCVVRVHIPPLRSRTEDIPSLAEHFLARFSARFGKETRTIPGPVFEALLAYAWPGNVRELQNSIERAVLLSEGDTLQFSALPSAVQSGGGAGRLAGDDGDLSVKRRVASLEADLIRRALKQTGGNRTHACKLLEISHRALLYKMKDFGIDIPSGKA